MAELGLRLHADRGGGDAGVHGEGGIKQIEADHEERNLEDIDATLGRSDDGLGGGEEDKGRVPRQERIFRSSCPSREQGSPRQNLG